jgi:hypothetical protein
MANFELRFIDAIVKTHFIKAELSKQLFDEVKVPLYCISVTGIDNGIEFQIILDKSTAIKFAKTLRTEINKITESEGQNG